MPNPPLIFDKKRLRHNRLRAQKADAGCRIIHDDVTSQLYERLGDIRRPFKTILDIGTRDLSLARLLLKEDPERQVVHAGFNAEKKPQAAPGLSIVTLDDEALPFPDGIFDLVIANMNLHAINDVPGALIQIRRALKPDGLFLAAFFGGETLSELRQCLDAAEMTTRGGVSPHLFPLIDVRDAGMLLTRAGFALPVIDRERITLMYRNAFQLMHDLRFMGEGNALHARDRRFMGKGFFRATDELYRKRFGDAEGRIPASFDILFMAGWAPHASQQIPLKPGAAKARLADALGTPEIGTGAAVESAKG